MALARTHWAGDTVEEPTRRDETTRQEPPYGALSPDRVRFYLRLLPFRDALPRPGATMKPKHHKKRSGNPSELTWAVYGDLLACIEQLSARRRDIVIRCTVYGDPYERVALRWRCHAATVWREERRAWDDIAEMTGWKEEEAKW